MLCEYLHKIGRRIGVDSHCGKHVPGAHLAGVVHAGISQMFGSHKVVVPRNGFTKSVNLGCADRLPAIRMKKKKQRLKYLFIVFWNNM